MLGDDEGLGGECEILLRTISCETQISSFRRYVEAYEHQFAEINERIAHVKGDALDREVKKLRITKVLLEEAQGMYENAVRNSRPGNRPFNDLLDVFGALDIPLRTTHYPRSPEDQRKYLALEIKTHLKKKKKLSQAEEEMLDAILDPPAPRRAPPPRPQESMSGCVIA